MYPVQVPPDNVLHALAALDLDLAAAVRAARCPRCGGPLHSASWTRKPRGADLPDDLRVRHGLCCGHCRARTLPPSVLFAGRRVYLKAVILLVVAARQRDRAQHTIARLQRLFDNVWDTTIARWMQAFPAGLPLHPDWQRLRGQLPATVRDDCVLAALLDLGSGDDVLIRACRLVPVPSL